jgi:putative tryptophan/tyrosine transport system substrate-binding protein
MERRSFITLFGGAVAAWPLAARAQQSTPMRRVSVLMLYEESDPEGQLRAAVLRQSLEKLGWVVGRNLQIVFRWGVGDFDWVKSAARELLRQDADVLLANSDAAARALQPVAGAVPIVFIGATDPVAQGFVSSIARPGGNMTGFTVLEPSVGPKLLELLKAIAPNVKRAGVLLNPDNAGSVLMAGAIVAAGTNFAVDATAIPIHQSSDIDAAVTILGREPGGGLIVPPDPVMAGHRKLIIELADRYQLPAIYGLRQYVANGGLISYGISIPELFRQAALYVDRILRGEKPADLPVQSPIKFELIINLKTAKTLSLSVPQGLLVAADEVIE